MDGSCTINISQSSKAIHLLIYSIDDSCSCIFKWNWSVISFLGSAGHGQASPFHAHTELWSIGQVSCPGRCWRTPARVWAHSDFGEGDSIRWSFQPSQQVGNALWWEEEWPGQVSLSNTGIETSVKVIKAPAGWIQQDPTSGSRTGHASYWLLTHTTHQTPHTIIFPSPLWRYSQEFPSHTQVNWGQQIM